MKDIINHNNFIWYTQSEICLRCTNLWHALSFCRYEYETLGDTCIYNLKDSVKYGL